MGPFAVSSNGSNVQTATGPASLLTIQNPLTKLDVTNIESFQTISLLFNSEPPQPLALSYTSTLVYSFAHGYTYRPSVWLQWQNASPAFPGNPSNGNAATTFYPFGDDTAGSELISNISGVNPGLNGQPLVGLTKYNNGGPIVQTTDALLVAKAYTTNVYIYAVKECLATISGSVIPIHLAGITLNIRAYVFTEPAAA